VLLDVQQILYVNKKISKIFIETMFNNSITITNQTVNITPAMFNQKISISLLELFERIHLPRFFSHVSPQQNAVEYNTRSVVHEGQTIMAITDTQFSGVVRNRTNSGDVTVKVIINFSETEKAFEGFDEARKIREKNAIEALQGQIRVNT